MTRCAAKGNESSPKAKSYSETISTDEENVIHFIGGYVPYKILQNLRRQKSSVMKVQTFTDCLLKKAVDGPEDSLLDYTTEWIKRIDRGSLFHTSDESFHFFKALEVKFRQVVMPIVTQPSSSITSTKTENVQQFLDDEAIRFHWELFAIDIENQDDSEELLIEIINLIQLEETIWPFLNGNCHII